MLGTRPRGDRGRKRRGGMRSEAMDAKARFQRSSGSGRDARRLPVHQQARPGLACRLCAAGVSARTWSSRTRRRATRTKSPNEHTGQIDGCSEERDRDRGLAQQQTPDHADTACGRQERQRAADNAAETEERRQRALSAARPPGGRCLLGHCGWHASTSHDCGPQRRLTQLSFHTTICRIQMRGDICLKQRSKACP